MKVSNFLFLFYSFKDDIRSLQLVYDRNLFSVGWKLFARKWKKNEKNFIKYFEDTYIKSNSEWFEGCGDKIPKTNNCAETANRDLKKQHTFYLRKPVKV